MLPSVQLQEQEKTKKDIALAINPKSSNDTQGSGSALHTGNFTEDIQRRPYLVQDTQGELGFPTKYGPTGTSPTSPRYRPVSFPTQRPVQGAQFPPLDVSPHSLGRMISRDRAPSLGSFSSSYVIKVPTSPLVQQSNNSDMDMSPITLSTSPGKGNRRHTLSPQDLHSLGSHNYNWSTPALVSRHAPSVTREPSFPFSHHKRRSLNSSWSLQGSPSPLPPSSTRSRRPSVSSEAASLQHASMVGSYEESILHGRMSTAPSKPLSFTAQIGALGKGTCKPKYPAHVTVPFPAVYYSWSSTAERRSSLIDDEPSPYVGYIDLEHTLPPVQVKKTRTKRLHNAEIDNGDESGNSSSTYHGHHMNDMIMKPREKRKRRSPSPKAPPGGSYRIPQQGQIQIVIKNPNKTAVKLFLVPYDLQDMEAGTKTFIRQRCYSAGPTFDKPITSKSGGESGDLRSIGSQDPLRKPKLRYLVHLNICSPSKGRFYLHQQIRVVFANRVPDGKENLQNEVQLPEPRYSIYNPIRAPLVPRNIVTDPASIAEKAYRTRSYPHGISSEGYATRDSLQEQSIGGGSSFPFDNPVPVLPVPAIPFEIMKTRRRERAATPVHHEDATDVDLSRPTTASDMQSPLSEKGNGATNLALSSPIRSNSSHSSDGYGKLRKGELGYGGLFGRPGTPEPGEGLLARKLRGLDVHVPDKHEVNDDMNMT